MNVFCIISSDDQVKDRVDEFYPDRKYRILDDVRVIADESINSAEVCEKLSIGESFNAGTAVVIRLDNYYGHFNGALWAEGQ